jgi:hypothetical protein
MNSHTRILQVYFSLFHHMSSHHRPQHLSHQEHAIVSRRHVGKQVTFAENNLFKTFLYYLRKLTFGKPMIGCAVNIVLWSVLVHI